VQVYCPSCGSPNETRPGGGKVMCTVCTAVFEAPGSEQKPPPPPSGEVLEARPSRRSEIPVGQLRPEPAARGIQLGQAGKWSVWSLVSLGTGVACSCIPLVGPAFALISGALAIRDIKRDPKLRGYPLAVTGLVLGALGVLWTVLVFISSKQ